MLNGRYLYRKVIVISMKNNIIKILVVVVIVATFLSSLGTGVNLNMDLHLEDNVIHVAMPSDNPENHSSITSMHTVMAELGAVSWCPHCPVASDEIYSLFSSGNYSFYYVTLVYNHNSLALQRGRWLNDKYIPVLYLDGGYKVVNDPSSYEQEIANVGERSVHNVSIDVSAKWVGNAKIEVTLTVTNNEEKTYFGHVRAYVTEIISRWNDEKGLPFHYAFLDFAINRYVFVGAGKTKEITTTWDGSGMHGNNTFGDIQKGNIMVVASTSYWMPFIQSNPWDKPKLNQFIAQFTDDADAVEI